MSGIQELCRKFPFPKTPPDVEPSNHGFSSSIHCDILRKNLSESTRVVVELGVWLGLTTRFIAASAPNAVILAVDHWKGSPEHFQNLEYSRYLPKLYDIFIRSCWEYRDRIVPIRCNTLGGLKLIHRYGVRPDLVYIDADHSYEAVRADFEATLSLFPNARVVGDDWQWEDVRRAVQEVSAKTGLSVASDRNCWWVV